MKVSVQESATLHWNRFLVAVYALMSGQLVMLKKDKLKNPLHKCTLKSTLVSIHISHFQCQ